MNIVMPYLWGTNQTFNIVFFFIIGETTKEHCQRHKRPEIWIFLFIGLRPPIKTEKNSRYITIIGAHDWRHFQIPFHACKLGYKSVCQSMPKWLHYYIGWATEYGVQMIFTILRRDPRNWLGMRSFFLGIFPKGSTNKMFFLWIFTKLLDPFLPHR